MVAMLALPAVLVLVLAATLPAAVVSHGDHVGRGCVASGTFDATRNYFSTAFSGEPFALTFSLNTTIKNAYNFSVEYHNYYKLVKDTHANTTYALYLCGAPKPQLNGVAINGFVEIPLHGYGIRTDVPAPFLQMLGVLDTLDSIQEGPVVDACMQAQAAATSLNQVANFTGAVIDADQGPYNFPNISFSATQDPGVLNRAEWIKYMALFFNREDVASEVFNNISSSYACLKGKAPASDSKPTVAWLGYYEGTWTLSGAAYKLQYVADAGGVSPPQAEASTFTTYTLSNATEADAFAALLLSVDVVLDETFLMRSPLDYNLATFTKNTRLKPDVAASIKFLSPDSPNVWSVYGQFHAGPPYPATAWFEMAVVQPQVVLQEIQAILAPSAFPASFKHTFFYNLGNGTPSKVTRANCTMPDILEEVQPTGIEGCQAAPSTVSTNKATALAPVGLALAASLAAVLLALF